MKYLFIVESPGKIKKISGFLGKDFVVKASVGHFRDLDPKKMSIDFANHFEPIYIITKPDVVKNLREAAKGVDLIYLATDSDFEGSGISQSILDVLKPKKYKRLLFNSITKQAILTAIKEGGEINHNHVNAQKTRRVLDRLYGYLISPLLQRTLGGKLSAGRVQSPTVELVIDRENEIRKFLEENATSSYFKVHGIFTSNKLRAILYESSDKDPYVLAEKKTKEKTPFKGKSAQIPLIKGDKPNAKVEVFMKRCLKSEFVVHSVTDRISLRSPAPPFTTSTLQQEANRKFGMSIDVTMRTAQKLYEGGYITYMRTDSVEISAEGHAEIKKTIEELYGKEYYHHTQYKTKSASAQEAHEAIRPVHSELATLDNEKEVTDPTQIKLYKLIWQRTIASQMKQAKINITTIQIIISKYLADRIHPYYYFQTQLEKVIFPGFMKVYVESVDDPEENDTVKINGDFGGKIPKPGDKLEMIEIVAKQEFPHPPPRYTQASLVKKLEELGIGRPSTYVNTIKTILDREYIKTSDIPGTEKAITTYTITSESKKVVYEEESTVLVGKESKKLVPTELGKTVNEYLLKNFPEMMDYKFTAKIEAELDKVADGKRIWYEVVQQFYDKLNPIVEKLKTTKIDKSQNDKLLGKDETGAEIFASKTKFGPRLKKMLGDKFVYAPIPESFNLENITLEAAIGAFSYPKLLGKYNGKEVFLRKGKKNFYVTYNGEPYWLPDTITTDIDLDTAIKKITETKVLSLKENGKTIKAIVFPKGTYGPYIQITRGKKKTNYKIPDDVNVDDLTEEKILEIISKPKTFGKFAKKKTNGENATPMTGGKKKTGAKTPKKGVKAATKKPAAKKPVVKKPVAKKPIVKKTSKE